MPAAPSEPGRSVDAASPAPFRPGDDRPLSRDPGVNPLEFGAVPSEEGQPSDLPSSPPAPGDRDPGPGPGACGPARHSRSWERSSRGRHDPPAPAHRTRTDADGRRGRGCRAGPAGRSGARYDRTTPTAGAAPAADPEPVATAPPRPPEQRTTPPPRPREATVVLAPTPTRAEAPAPAGENAGADRDRARAARSAVRVLPPGFRAKLEAGVNDAGWPLVIVGERDGGTMVLVPGATFIMGKDGGSRRTAPHIASGFPPSTSINTRSPTASSAPSSATPAIAACRPAGG